MKMHRRERLSKHMQDAIVGKLCILMGAPECIFFNFVLIILITRGQKLLQLIMCEKKMSPQFSFSFYS